MNALQVIIPYNATEWWPALPALSSIHCAREDEGEARQMVAGADKCVWPNHLNLIIESWRRATESLSQTAGLCWVQERSYTRTWAGLQDSRDKRDCWITRFQNIFKQITVKPFTNFTVREVKNKSHSRETKFSNNETITGQTSGFLLVKTPNLKFCWGMPSINCSLLIPDNCCELLV